MFEQFKPEIQWSTFENGQRLIADLIKECNRELAEEGIVSDE
jgi:hypothetical protein